MPIPWDSLSLTTSSYLSWAATRRVITTTRHAAASNTNIRKREIRTRSITTQDVVIRSIIRGRTSDVRHRDARNRDAVCGVASRSAIQVILLDIDAIVSDTGEHNVGVGDVRDRACCA
jgi:hypothetical protein